MLKTYQFKNSL